MRDDPGAVDRADREWELDRKAWNLPRPRRTIHAVPTDEAATHIDEDSTPSHDIQRLPDDVSGFDRAELREASETRDKRLSILFRQWPTLGKLELREMRRLNDERQRLARRLGVLRSRRRTRSEVS